ncbi:Rieske (2Fe-2S) protein [Corynebacterium halotolerans]|uniref:Rieske (2Fe-2S) protein n=1 Tax=Corynebacterium halotolerans TaxID=225326 RepID=UPI003CF8DB91
MIEQSVRVARVADIAPGTATVITPEVSGHPTPIALFHTADGFHAVDDTCTHLGASLARSKVVDGEVDCWLHHGRFCLRTGEATYYPARNPLQVFPVEVRDDEVWLVPGRG